MLKMKEKRLLECNASETRKAEPRNLIQMTAASVSNSFFLPFQGDSSPTQVLWQVPTVKYTVLFSLHIIPKPK